MSSKAKGLAGATLLAACLCFGCGGGGPGAASTGAPGATAGFPAALSDRFALLRGARTAADEIPPRMIPARVVTAMQLEMEKSRRARSFQGRGVYVVPMPRLICLVSGNEAVGNCWPLAVVAHASAIATSICGPGLAPGRSVTFGIVPDGVRRVTVVRTDVPSRSVPVRGNVFIAETSSKPPLPLHVAWSDGGTRVVRSSGIPARVARQGCAPPSGLGRR